MRIITRENKFFMFFRSCLLYHQSWKHYTRQFTTVHDIFKFNYIRLSILEIYLVATFCTIFHGSTTDCFSFRFLAHQIIIPALPVLRRRVIWVESVETSKLIFYCVHLICYGTCFALKVNNRKHELWCLDWVVSTKIWENQLYISWEHDMTHDTRDTGDVTSISTDMTPPPAGRGLLLHQTSGGNTVQISRLSSR